MGSMDGQLALEIDYTQSKSVDQSHVLFLLLHLLYCIDLCIVQVLDHRHMILLTQKC